MTRLIALALTLVLPACSGDQAVPSGEENEQLDSAENLLNNAPDELETVGERIPEGG